MPVTGALIFCSCGHVVAEHNNGGKCRGQSPAEWPCDCQQLDTDDGDNG